MCPVFVTGLPRALLQVQVLEGELARLLLAVGPQRRIEEQFRVDASVRGGDDGSRAAGRLDGLPEVRALLLTGPVRLVQYDEVGDGQVPVDLGMAIPGRPELGRVHDLDQSPVHDVRVVAGQEHPYEFLGFREPARLDDDHVEAGGGAGQGLQVGVQFARVDRAAQTAAAQRDGGADLPGDGHGVDLDGPEVVDDHPDAVSRAMAQEVVEQRRLAGSEEAREDDDGDLPAAGRGRRVQRGPSCGVTRPGPAGAGADRHTGPPGG